MKKLAYLFVVGLAMFAFTACGGGTTTNEEAAPAAEEAAPVDEEAADVDTNAVEVDTTGNDQDSANNL